LPKLAVIGRFTPNLAVLKAEKRQKFLLKKVVDNEY
jgi:hypothetical protein